jgi:anti-sigma factor RsiW
MNCERIETMLVAYLDGKARESERREVEAHLEACAACRKRAEEFRRVWSVLDEVPAVEPSLGFDARVRQRVAAEPRPRPFAWLIPQPRFALAVTLLLALAVWISSVAPAPEQSVAAGNDEEFEMIQNLPVLEDYEVLAHFEVLSDVPTAKTPAQQQAPGKL